MHEWLPRLFDGGAKADHQVGAEQKDGVGHIVGLQRRVVDYFGAAATSFSQCAVECLGNVVQCSYARSAAHASTRDAVGHSSMRIVRHALRRAGRVQAITEVKGPKIGAEGDVTHTL